MIAGCISFGSLSHSHLHQVLKNIRAGMAGTVKSILDSSGHYSLVMLRNVDPTFASHAGLWEALRWKTEQEEPDACVITQAALNSKGALFMISQDMQAFACLCSLASVLAENHLASSLVESTAVETIRRTLRSTLPQHPREFNALLCCSRQGLTGWAGWPFQNREPRQDTRFASRL